ncbi:MAG TPA: carbohydrate kinase family protein [Candidatus Lokiarchaeia archaeon]|nr:carbohydrate kinase family protein [Candidatus Lokiarchaeia archaeon]
MTPILAMITILGPMNVDLIIHGSAPETREELLDWVGTSNVSVLTAGAIGYFASVAHTLGHDVTVFTTIGDDPLGLIVRDSLEKLGSDLSFLEVQGGTSTAIAIYMLLFGSKKRPLTYQLPTHDLWPLKFTKKHLDAVSRSDWFHHGGYLHFPQAWKGSVLELFRHARACGIGTSIDPQFPLIDYPAPWVHVLEPILPFVDILFVDKNEACNLMNMEDHVEAARALLEKGPRIVIVKLGEEGSILIDEDDCITQPAERISPDEIVDSIGAGDSFDAGFLDAWFANKSKVECLERATSIAARTLRYPGGVLGE